MMNIKILFTSLLMIENKLLGGKIMDRCKLEYMFKRFDFTEKKKMIVLIDPYGDYEFKKDISRFLLNPNTTDENILINLPLSLV